MKNSELLEIIKNQQETIAMLFKMLNGGDVYTLSYPPDNIYSGGFYPGESTSIPTSVSTPKSEEL